jgi:peptidoglycan/LPS O-acetylase OafA/YrhL
MNPIIPSTRPGRISALDGLRGLAALTVFFWHCVDIFDPLCIGSEVRVRGMPLDISGCLLGGVVKWFPIHWVFNGTFSVKLFFVLSGYVLTRLVRTKAGGARVYDLVVQRYFRLLPMVLVGTLLAYAILGFGLLHLFDLYSINKLTNFIIYEPLKALGGPSLGGALYDSFVGNWTLDQSEHYNRVMWSIGVEFVDSVLLLLIYSAFSQIAWRTLARVMVAVLGMALTNFNFLYFAAGSYLADSLNLDPAPRPPGRGYLPWLILMGSLIIGSLRENDRFQWLPLRFLAGLWEAPHGIDTAHIFGALGLIWLALEFKPMIAFLHLRAVQFLGYVSYAFYAIHQPILHSLGAASAVTLDKMGMGYVPATAISSIICLVLSLVGGFLLTRFVDVPFNRLSKAFVREIVSRDAGARAKFYRILGRAWRWCNSQ